MAFVPKIEVTTQNGSKSVTLKDVTGTVLGGTPTGWGDPNPAGAINTVLQYADYLKTATGEYQGPYLGLPLLDNGWSITVVPSNFGLSTDSFPDGVGAFKAVYIVGGSPVTWVPGSKRVSLINPQNFITAAKYVSFQIENEVAQKYFLYTIDESKPLEVDGFYVLESLPAGGVSQMYVGYEADTFALFTKEGEDCLAVSIGEFAVTSQKVPCALTEELNYRFSIKESAQIYFTAGNYPAAHDLALELKAFCSTSNSTCGCS